MKALLPALISALPLFSTISHADQHTPPATSNPMP